MTATLEAIYEHGVLRLAAPLPLPEHAHVRVTVQSDATASDAERAEWASASQAALLKTWDNPADDVFNELLTK
jgi:predicted DNA-binding antitoxin AbrB/MazE fold protein